MLEDLLKRRYEVIADYPNSLLEIGDILIQYEYSTSTTGMYVYVTNTESPLQGNSLNKKFAETMPHLFRKMNWWEKRTAEQMPKKVKSLADEKGSVYEIQEWDMEMLVGWIDKKERSCCSLLSFKPEYGYVPFE